MTDNFLVTTVSNGVEVVTGYETEWLGRRAERRAASNGAVASTLFNPNARPMPERPSIVRPGGLREAARRTT